jgi:hypothetical protein
MNTTSAAMEIPTTTFTTVSGSLTAMRAPIAEVMAVMIPSGSSSFHFRMPARAKRAVAEMVMNVTANMFVATAWRGVMPTMIISGTLIKELPPVMAPTAPVTSMRPVRIAICVADMKIGGRWASTRRWLGRPCGDPTHPTMPHRRAE